MKGVCLSICLSVPAYRFAAVGLASRRYRLIAAAVVGECGQCYFISIRRKLNTD